MVRGEIKKCGDDQATDTLAARDWVDCKFGAGTFDHVGAVEMRVTDDRRGSIAHQYMETAVVTTVTKMKVDMLGERVQAICRGNMLDECNDPGEICRVEMLDRADSERSGHESG